MESIAKLVTITHWDGLSPDQRRAALARPAMVGGDIQAPVAEILDQVRAGGDQALRELTERFDNAVVDELEVDGDVLANAKSQVDADLLDAIDRATGRICEFHRAGIPAPVNLETAKGLQCQALYRPIDPVGLYVPGGSAPLISTVIMLATPASLAGCENIVLCTPPGPDGNVDPAILAAASRCGVQRVFRVGGAQAIAAMAFSTESIPACAKLFGPGNAWVTEAKRQVSSMPGGAAQDIPAGPSEVLVIADDNADPMAVAWDLLSQAEHGPDSQALLLSDDEDMLQRVAKWTGQLAAGLPRADILKSSLRSLRLILVDSLEQAVSLSNDYAPEHLILNCERAEVLIESVTAAGSVFLGPWTPESLGDYSSGTNHVLPTYGYARAYSGLSVADFMRRMTVQRAAPEGLQAAGPDAMAMAAAEGLEAHRMAVAYRLGKLE